MMLIIILIITVLFERLPYSSLVRPGPP